MCQGVDIKKNNRIDSMTKCINCENYYWNEQIKAGCHTNVVLLSPERLKKRVKNENHRRKVTSLTLRNAQKKLDNLKDQVDAKNNEGGDLFLLLKKDFFVLLLVMSCKVKRVNDRKRITLKDLRDLRDLWIYGIYWIYWI